MIGGLAGGGGLIILAGIIMTILGIGGRAALKFQGFTFIASAGVVAIIFGIIILAFGITL
jgi:hypothetical protein